jgi:hypothetical protein
MEEQNDTINPVENKSKKDSKVSARKKFKIRKRFLVSLLFFFILVGAVASSYYFYNEYQNLKTDPVTAVQEKNTNDADRVVKKATSILLVQESDKPTVARVEDQEKLKSSNEFYKNVEKGDYLIIYPKRIIIYRESNNQIINVAPIVTTPGSSQPGTTPATNN